MNNDDEIQTTYELFLKNRNRSSRTDTIFFYKIITDKFKNIKIITERYSIRYNIVFNTNITKCILSS